MMIPASMLRHRVTVHRKVGQGWQGPVMAPDATLRALVDDSSDLRRDAQGREVASSAQFVCRLGSKVEIGDEVTLPSGRRTKAIRVANGDDAGMGAWQHTLVTCE